MLAVERYRKRQKNTRGRKCRRLFRQRSRTERKVYIYVYVIGICFRLGVQASEEKRSDDSGRSCQR